MVSDYQLNRYCIKQRTEYVPIYASQHMPLSDDLTMFLGARPVQALSTRV